MTRRQVLIIILVILFLLSLISCTAKDNMIETTIQNDVQYYSIDEYSEPYEIAEASNNEVDDKNEVDLQNSETPMIEALIQELDDWMIDGEFFNAGCSWYCAGEVQSVISSSDLGQNELYYSAIQAHDWELKTAWIEGNPDYGAGEYLEYSLAGNVYDLTVNHVILLNGYVKSDELWKEYSRVKTLEMYINNKLYSVLNVKDTSKVQVFTFKEISLNNVENVKIRFVISDIYKGEKYKNTAITELQFEGTGHH